MAHIAFVVPRFHTNLFHATAALLDAGHAVSVLATGAGSGEDHSRLTPILLGTTPEPGAMKETLQRLKPDLLFIRTAADLSRQAAKVARQQGLRAMRYDLLTLDGAPTAKQRLLHWWRGLPGQRVTPVRTPGDRAERHGAAHFLPWPVTRWADVAVTDAVLRQTPVPVLCVGKLGSPRKNHLPLIEALEALGGGEVARLTLVGSLNRVNFADGASYHDTLQQAVDARDWIEMRAEVPYAEMPRLFADHAICVLPSVDEPLGFAPVEGMAFGTIPVISAQSGSAGYLTGGTDGVIVDMQDPTALRGGLEPLLHDAGTRRAMSAAARATAESELSPKRFVERMEAILAAG